MAYGYRKRYTKRYTRRATRRTRARATSSYKKMGRRFVRQPRFAVASYARDVEKKYKDGTFQIIGSENNTGWDQPVVGQTNVNMGITYKSTHYATYRTDTLGTGVPVTTNGNMLSGINTGTTAYNRVGNKITPKYIKGTATFNAAVLFGGGVSNEMLQGGEALVDPNKGISAYLRTTIRYAIVKDTQVNNTGGPPTWDDVFRGNAEGSLATGVFGLHAELNTYNMSRYIVLQDKTFQLDADDPMKTVKFKIDGTKIGRVRFNSGDSVAVTDKSIYIIYSAFVTGGVLPYAANLVLPFPIVSHRLCFTDA